MTEKEKAKRKGNPRRRQFTLMIMCLFFIGAMASFFVYQQQLAQGQHIATLIHHDNSATLEILSLSGRVISTHHIGVAVCPDGWHVIEPYIYYKNVQGDDCAIAGTLTRQHLDTDNHIEFDICPLENCAFYKLSPDGNWISTYAYRINQNNNRYVDELALHLYHIETDESFRIHDLTRIYNRVPSLQQLSYNGWIPNSDLFYYVHQFDFNTMESTYFGVDASEYRLVEPNFIAVQHSHQIPIVSSDGMYYALPQDMRSGQLQEGVGIYETTSQNPILEDTATFLTSPDRHLMQVRVQDWHPQEPILLVAEIWERIDTYTGTSNLYLYDALTGSETSLHPQGWRDTSIINARFDASGAYVLVNLHDFSNATMLTGLIDVETGETTYLPNKGDSAQWVN